MGKTTTASPSSVIVKRDRSARGERRMVNETTSERGSAVTLRCYRAAMGRWALTAFAVVIAGCTSTVSPSPLTTSAPSATPTEAPTSAPTTTATATPASIGGDVIFRMSVGGGLRYPGATLEEAPVFSLYDDGRVIYTRATPRHQIFPLAMSSGRRVSPRSK